MNLVKRLDLLLNKAEAVLLITFLSVMVVLAFLQVVLRNAFSAGFLWADILLRHLLLWVGFLGAAIATSENRHINIDALRRFLPPRVLSIVEVVTDLFAALVCAFLTRASLRFLQDEMASRNMLFAGIPGWYGVVIIPIGFALLVIHFVLRAMLRAENASKAEPTA